MTNMVIKQMLVVRGDLQMPMGKTASQCCHASTAIILNNLGKFCYNKFLYWIGIVNSKSPIYHWVNGSFTKIVVYVNSEAELEAVYQKAINKGLLTSMIVDEGRTIFNGVSTKTVVGIGPAWSTDLIGVTDKLKLL